MIRANQMFLLQLSMIFLQSFYKYNPDLQIRIAQDNSKQQQQKEMKHKIFYSDQEQEKQKYIRSHQENSIAQTLSTNPPQQFENAESLIKEYQNKIYDLAPEIPLKSVISVKLPKKIQEPKEDETQSSNTRSYKMNQKSQNAKTAQSKSKQPFKNQIQASKTGFQASQPKTKFRSLSFKKVRRMNGPHSQFYFNQFNLQKTKQPEITQQKEIFYSDASEEQENGDPPKQSQQQHVDQVPECKLQNDVPQVQKNEGKFMVNKHNISKLYEYISIQLESAQYLAEENQDPFFHKIFSQAIADLSYKASTQRSSHLLSKGRHFLVRRIMQVFANIPPKNRQQQRFVRNRLTIRQRDMMIKASLPIPPPRLTVEFLNALFQNKKFRQFFKEFIYTGQLQQILMDRSKVQIAKYDSYYKQIGLQNISLEEKLVKLKRDPPPLSWLEVRLFMQEAYSMSDKYCNQ